MAIKQIKQFRFWTNSEEVEFRDWLLSFDNTALMMKKVLKQYQLGELISPNDQTLKEEQIKINIEYKKTQIAINNLRIKYYNTFEGKPSSRADKVMRINVENQITETPSCLDEKNHRIMCPECGSCFVFADDQHDIADSKEYFIDHYVQKHSLKFPPQLAKELQSF